MAISRPLPTEASAEAQLADNPGLITAARRVALVATVLVLSGPAIFGIMWLLAWMDGKPTLFAALEHPGAWRFASRLGTLWDYAVDLPLIGCVFAIISCVIRANCLAFLVLGGGLAFVALAFFSTLRLFG